MTHNQIKSKGEMIKMEHYKNLGIEDIAGEVWEQFYEGKQKTYFVSNYGRVKSVDIVTEITTVISQRLKKHAKKKNGQYHKRLYVKIFLDGKLVNKSVSRLVAVSFLPNPNSLPVVAHIDNNPLNNHVSNLRFDTQSGNVQQAYDDGLIDKRQPAIVLNTNAEIIDKHNGIVEALSAYDGTYVKYDNGIYSKGNVIIMKQSYYDELTDNERFSICSRHFEHMTRNLFIVDGQIINGVRETAETIGITTTTLRKYTNKLNIAHVNGHEVSRFKHLIGVGGIS